MAKAEADDRKFMQQLDSVLAGGRPDPSGLNADERADLDFASRMLVSRDEPTPEYRLWLRSRLMRRLALETQRAVPVEKEGLLDWLLERRKPVLASVISLAVLLLIVVTGLWYAGRAGAPMATAPASPLPAGDYAVKLPSRIAPAGIKFSSEQGLSTAPGTAAVYELKSRPVSLGSVAGLADGLGLSGQPELSPDGSRIDVIDTSGEIERRLTVWAASGAVEYTLFDPELLIAGDGAAELPTRAEAARTGYNVLLQSGLLPYGYHSFSDVQGGIRITGGGGYPVQDAKTGQAVEGPARYWIVDFPCTVNGLEATGPGAKIEAVIGAGGRVISLFSYWREATPRYTGRVISPDEAFRELAEGGGSIDIPVNSSAVVIREVNLKLWMDPPSTKQSLAVPVYEFTGWSLDKNGRVLEGFTAWTEALE
ncbi:MAG: hypothetical protein PHO26_07200 [Dehalococcoidia bacterium]|nr:hypothetical protein [Dehalococcoidia bacterium]MDD5495151.1 hypothetical protein [Dehalococcoidia bacterium]